jgi:N-acetylmuramoyl-L-alanine amidase
MSKGGYRLSVLAGVAALLAGCQQEEPGASAGLAGEAERGGLTVSLSQPVTEVKVTEGRVPRRPLVVIDPGHGGRDPGATGVASGLKEAALTLAVARELRARLAARGRVRVALTRDSDRSLDLDQRSDIARRLGARLFVSLHADSAADTQARGASVYSLSEVASDADAARLAAEQNGERGGGGVAEAGVRALLTDLAVRDSMNASADFALRLVRTGAGQVEWRPDPHRFAALRVLRRAEAPAVLVEMGYLSNAADEAMLRDPVQRARLVAALAQAIETETALAAASR